MGHQISIMNQVVHQAQDNPTMKWIGMLILLDGESTEDMGEEEDEE